MASHSKYSLLMVVLASIGVMLGGAGLVIGLSLGRVMATLPVLAMGSLFMLPLAFTGLRYRFCPGPTKSR